MMDPEEHFPRELYQNFNDKKLQDEQQRRELLLLFNKLKQESTCVLETLQNQEEDFKQVIQALIAHLDDFDFIAVEILDFAPKYDFKYHRANGYRSLILVTRRCLLHILSLLKCYNTNRSSYLFRINNFIKDLTSYVHAAGQIRDTLHYAKKLIEFSPQGQLVPSETLLDTPLAVEIQMEMDMIDQECFYGRTLGFQFCESMKKAFETVHIGIAAYSHNYNKPLPRYAKLASSLYSSSQYILNPEKRAKRVVDVTLNCDIEFCKAMWNLPETDLLHNMARLALPSCKVNHVFKINPSDLTMPTNTGGTVTIKQPDAHIGHMPLQMRLMSNTFRVGQDRLPGLPFPNQFASEPAKSLIIQCHGGGFVSQTSRTHEAYLRQWAEDLDVPFLCIDYSLAPNAPFPRAFQEVYYAYVWALQNKHLLGTTAERVAVVGDSAGGNLLLAMLLQAIQDNIQLPDGILAVYTPVYIQFIPSPSRVLSVMDPLLPVGILTRCLQAYAGDLIATWRCDDNTHQENEKNNKSNYNKPLIRQRSSSFSDELEGEDSEIQSILQPPSHTTIEYNSCDEDEKFVSPPTSPLNSPVQSVINLHVPPPSKHHGHFIPGHNRTGSLPVMSDRIKPIIPRRHDNTRHFAQSPLYKFAKIRIEQNPKLSPLHADDELLKHMPATYMVACHLDPCLDDSIMFCKKLDKLGVNVHLDTVDEVPHGFMNFCLVSNECKKATDLCCRRLREIIEPA